MFYLGNSRYYYTKDKKKTYYRHENLQRAQEVYAYPQNEEFLPKALWRKKMADNHKYPSRDKGCCCGNKTNKKFKHFSPPYVLI